MFVKQKVVFTEEECQKIIQINKINSQIWKSTDRKYISKSIEYNKNTEWIFNKLKSFFETETNIEILNLKKSIHFHKFVKGDWFAEHNDERDYRMYAIGVLLNDNFIGGNFVLHKDKKIILDKKIGNAYIFDVKIKHEIEPILEGERYSILWFLQNWHIKNINSKII